jgi:four helix bundle protein
MSIINSYKDLHVWQKSMIICEEVYKITKTFPSHEVYGLTSQIRRCSVSIPSNIAEGRLRGHRAEYKHFLYIAYGSGAELETQLQIALRIGYINNEDYTKITSLLGELMRMLNKLISSLKPST